MSQSFRFGEIEVRPSERALIIDGRRADIGSRAFDVLLALITNRDRVVTKNELLDTVWPGLVVEENNLQAQVSALRKLLGVTAISTIPGRGYQFVAPGTVADSAVPAAASPVILDAPAVKRPQSRQRLIAALAGSAAVLLGVAGYWSYEPPRSEIARPPAPGQVVNAPTLSIAVLPFSNFTGDIDQGYVADGLTASLTADLSRIRDAFIVDASTAFAYKDRAAKALEVGKELGVRFVLYGNVQRAGGKIRINAQLADATTNAQLWSETFEGDSSDMFALQDKVTTRISNTIGREMVIVAARTSETRKSQPEVSDLILRAKALNLRPESLKNKQQMESWYRQALLLEPNNPSAMVGLADSLVLQALHYGSGYAFDDDLTEQKLAEARDLAVKVRELDPDNPEAYLAIAGYAMRHDDYAGARRAIEANLVLDAKNPRAYNNLALMCLNGGEPKRAIELLSRAISLDPKHVSESVLINMGRAYFALGDNDAAIEWYLQGLQANPNLNPAFPYLPVAYALKGDDAKAKAALVELHRIAPNFRLSKQLRPSPSSPTAYKDWFEGTWLPSARKAGLPD